MTKTTMIGHSEVTFNNDQSLTVVKRSINGNIIGTQSIPAEDLQSIASELRGVNRIHKPMVLLFWIDCKNGQSKNW